MPTRLTFGSEADKLRMVVDNGVDISDPRIMTRTNEATQLILGMQHPQTGEPIIPVGSMMLAVVRVTEHEFLLPPEMESAIHVERDDGDPLQQTDDIRQGDYNILNPFTYVDPSMSHDNPFVDLFWKQLPASPTVNQRAYSYPGFADGIITVIGPKAYVPITRNEDYLIVQNVPALKTMIQAIEYRENNQGALWKEYYNDCRDLIIGEIKKHQMDPRWIMKRKADYERDLTIYGIGSKGWTRARIGLEVPGTLMVGKVDIDRVIDRGQLRMMEHGTYKGCIQEFNARITDGHVYFPSIVQSVLSADIAGCPVSVRSMFYKYLVNGPGEGCCGGGRLVDEGERFFKDSGQRRRVYRARVGTDGSEVVAVCKLRWEPKKSADQLTITNFEANRLMVQSILLEQDEKWNEAAACRELVLGKDGILQKELAEYLAGIKHTIPFAIGGGGILSSENMGEYL